MRTNRRAFFVALCGLPVAAAAWGGGTTNVTVTIQAWDGVDVKRVVQSREFADALARNTNTIGTRTKAALK